MPRERSVTPSRPLAAACLAIACAGLAVGDVDGAGQFPRGLLRAADKTCTIETRPLSFGTYGPSDPAPTDAQAQIVYACGVHTVGRLQGRTATNIRIEISRGEAGSFDRAMTSGTARLSYNIFLDAQRQTVWGNGSGGTQYFTDVQPPNQQPITLYAYGRIPALQNVPQGEYADSLQVVILF